MAYIPPNPNGQAPSANSSPVVIASDQSAVPVQGNVAGGATDTGNSVKTGGVYNTSLPTYSSGQRADAQYDQNGRQYVNQRALSAATDFTTASLSPGTANGWTPSSQPTLSTTVASIKSSAGNLGGWYMFNPNTATAFIQFFNATTGNVTLGTTAATFVIAIPAGAGSNVEYANGISFNTAISVAATTTYSGSTALSSAVVAMFLRA